MTKVEIEKNTDELSQSRDAAREEATTPPETTKKKAVWQFKYRQYQTILDIVDENALPSNSGRRPNITVKARNYRVELDLSDKRDKSIHEALLKSSRNELDFWELRDAKKGQKTEDQGETLKRLMDMNDIQLRGVLSDNEMREAGLNPSTADRFDIIMAVINSANKRLGGSVK